MIIDSNINENGSQEAFLGSSRPTEESEREFPGRDEAMKYACPGQARRGTPRETYG